MLIKNATIVNEGERYSAALLIKDGIIERIMREDDALPHDEETIDASGCLLLPGVIDDHVHMRDPGLTHKADMDTETRAAAAGGVTTVMDMPNVVPQTTTLELLRHRYDEAAEKCHVNYGFFLGATSSNINEIKALDPRTCPGVKLFMGSSTGNMLVDKEEQLNEIFRLCPTLLMTHCEDTERINERMDEAIRLYGEDPDVSHHPEIRDREVCIRSTRLAIRMAQKHGSRLHIAHLTTAEEVQMLKPNDPLITAEACVAHLLFTDKDYNRLGTRIKCNPSIKAESDRDALRKALTDGRIMTVGTDHAPHLMTEKQGGCQKAVSGMPMVQFSLPSMLMLTDQGVLSIERMVELMCHNPARLLRIDRRGFIREGYHADLTLVRPNSPWTLTADCIQSRCAWSPLEGQTFSWKVEKTVVNGNIVWDGKNVNLDVHGEPALHNPV